MAPEIYECQFTKPSNYKPFDAHSIDVWALGPIMFAMLSGGVVPWENPHINFNTNFTEFSNGSQKHLVHWVGRIWMKHEQKLRSLGFTKDKWVSIWFETNNETREVQSTPCLSLLREICRYNPRERLSLQQVKEHNWMHPTPQINDGKDLPLQNKESFIRKHSKNQTNSLLIIL